MDSREDIFIAKLACAAQHLGVQAHQVVSLKLRENVGGYHEYQELVRALEREGGVPSVEIDGHGMQGSRSYLLGDKNAKVVLVEHESGLEILYVAGSIASIITLIPLALQCWRSIRGHFSSHPGNVEIRRLDGKGHLQEERSHDVGQFVGMPTNLFAAALASAAKAIETDFNSLAVKVQALTDRVETLEKTVAKPKHRKTQAKKKSSVSNA